MAPARDGASLSGSRHEAVGVLHLHSDYSDGRGSVERILAAARGAGLDFVVLTDHDTAAPRREGWEGRRGTVTLVCATEITPHHRGHCVAMGVRDGLGFARLPEHETLRRIGEAGGFAVIAHPRGEHRPEFRIRHVPWLSWDHPAVGGIEIWSYMHDWIARLNPLDLGGFGRFFRLPNAQLRGPYADVLRAWDAHARKRRLAGVSGLDCHSSILPLVPWEIFPYEAMFRALRTHLFVASPRPTVRDVLEAIRRAAGFVALDALADSRGTRFEAQCVCGAHVAMGEEHACAGPARVRLRLPRAARCRLVADGRTVLEAQGDGFEAPASSPGVYRAEARLGGRPWVFTNHIYLRGPARSDG